MGKIKIITFILFVWAHTVCAQTNNFFYGGLGIGYYFDANGKLQYNTNLPLTAAANTSSISNFKGKLALYCGIDVSNYEYSNVYNANNQIIENGDSINLNGVGLHEGQIMAMADTINYWVYGGPMINGSNTKDVYFTYIKKDDSKIGGYYVPANKKNIKLSFPLPILNMGVCRNKQAQPIYIIRTKEYFYTYKTSLTGAPLQIIDSFYYPKYCIRNDSMRLNPNLEVYCYNEEGTMDVSNNGEYIAFSESFIASQIIPRKAYFRFHRLFMMKFDKDLGKFYAPQLIDSSKWHTLINPNDFKTQFMKGCFSPNDSIYYRMNLSKDNNFITDHVDLVQYDYLNNTKKTIAQYNGNNLCNPFVRYVITLNHLGELFYFTDICGQLFKANLNKLLKPNQIFPACNLQSNVEQSMQYSVNYQNFLLYDYLRTDHNIQYDCKATVSIKNNSQYYIGFTNYTWHIQNEKGIEQYYYTKEPPPLIYTKNGDYVIKLFGYSPRGKGYGEWYIDTIKVRIPPKPIANFYAKDSIVCRYTGLQFYNYSHAKDTLKNEYLWSFGDGNTSAAKNPVHTYTKPGVYTVTLHYKNGYCDSTLTKNQYIKVVDAPKPGFTVQYKQGCAPFVAQFTDTTTLNVQQKDYFFTDTKLWQNVPVNQPTFTHTFAKAGVYKAFQRLTGYSGCVIMQDSVVFNISKGLTAADTVHVINSTVQAKNALVYWPSINGAVKYQVYKNTSPYKQVTDTFFNESTPYLQDASYTIAGIDSCGNTCSQGRQGKPVFLKATMVGNNEAAVISFSPYQQWQGNNITYAIQKLVNGNWQTISSQNANNGYTDNTFLNLGELQACYRIESNEAKQPQIISYSNEVCLPYIPTIFIPTAFSPNNDAVNDKFDIVGYGLKSYTITVFNRWGEQIFKGNPNQAWDGGNAADGVYTARIEYTTNKGIKLNQRVTVTLIK